MARGQHARAATLLSAVAETDDDPYWSHRAGESYLRLAEPATARRLLERAAAGYRARGHAAKANAIDKMIAALPSAPR